MARLMYAILIGVTTFSVTIVTAFYDGAIPWYVALTVIGLVFMGLPTVLRTCRDSDIIRWNEGERGDRVFVAVVCLIFSPLLAVVITFFSFFMGIIVLSEESRALSKRLFDERD